jgi:poly-gamma-glutamate capsule biosynthesis protein CapA/YwtB (metallophosphatase superfamily)
MFARVAPVIERADLALCHLETPLSVDNEGLSGYPTFEAPRELATAIAAAGYDGCSTASNHSMDRGSDGVDETIEVMNQAGLGHAGTSRTDQTGREATRYSAGGVEIAHLSFTYGLNGFTLPSDRPWLVGLTDPNVIEQEASAARAAGAEFIILSLHWGAEYQTTPTAEQLAQAERLAQHPDIDLIIGHHAHVVQPVAEIAGTPVVFGLGNFLSNQSSQCCVEASQDGVIVEVALKERRMGGFDTEVRFVPTWVDRSDYVIMPAAAYLSENPDSTLAGPLGESWSRTVATMTSMGADVVPVGSIVAG